MDAAAAAAFQQAVRLNPDHLTSEYEAGICLDKMGDRQGAREQYKKLLRKDEAMAKKLKREIGIRESSAIRSEPLNADPPKSLQ